MVRVFGSSFWKLRRDSHISLAMNISRQTASFMTTMVGSIYMAQQSAFLGRMLVLARSNRPVFLIRHCKWDETSLWTSVDVDKTQRRVASAWQVMVCKQRLVVGFEDGSVAIIKLVVPPVVLLAAGAQHMFYALTNHPMFKSIENLVNSIAELSYNRIQIFESDGAYANERLIAHLIQRNKSCERPMHLLHVKCQNHQTQLCNVSLIASVGANVLSRMYALTVFIRNLGNFVRLKQALFAWIDENLIFVQDIADIAHTDAESYKSHDPGILELIDFLRSNRKVDSQCSDTSTRFEEAVNEFLEMFNGSSDLQQPCHRCTQTCFPAHQRHCDSRQTAVRRCASALISLLLGSMPAVPAPNKWTTVYPCLESWIFSSSFGMALSSSLNDVCFLLCCFLADRLHFNLHLFPTFEDDDDCLCPMPHSPIYLKIDLLLNIGVRIFYDR